MLCLPLLLQSLVLMLLLSLIVMLLLFVLNLCPQPLYLLMYALVALLKVTERRQRLLKLLPQCLW